MLTLSPPLSSKRFSSAVPGPPLQGAPVTTLDFDFLYRTSRANQTQLHKVAALLGGQVTQPFPAISTLFRILRPNSPLQIDLVSQIHGVKSFNTLRANAVGIDIGGRTILVASLADIIWSKKEANRPQDVAVLHVLQRSFERQKAKQANRTGTGPRSDASSE